MELRFDISLVHGYKSTSQIARILTEDWLARNMYCPICGKYSIEKAEANAPVKDYVCNHCKSQYELKSKRENSDKYDSKVNDGVYKTMINRITSLDNPNFFFMHYDNYEVNNLIIVPKCFFVPEVIEKRKPLGENAKRARWEGCNILLNQIPASAKIPIIKNKVVLDSKEVCERYSRIYSLQVNSIDSRGWLSDILSCVDRLESTFTLNQMYTFVKELKIKHPTNNNIEAKIRQQLQLLRDKGFLEFSSRGNYKKIDL